MWTEPDDRKAKNSLSRSLRSLQKDESTAWIVRILQPYLLQSDVLGGVSLQAEKKPRSNVALRAGRLANHETGASVLKEVVVFREPPVVHIFDVESHGRRFFRSLVFASSAAYTLHTLPPTIVASEAEELLLREAGRKRESPPRHSTLLTCAGTADSIPPPKSGKMSFVAFFSDFFGGFLCSSSAQSYRSARRRCCAQALCRNRSRAAPSVALCGGPTAERTARDLCVVAINGDRRNCRRRTASA